VSDPVFMVCDSANIVPSSTSGLPYGACSAPYWVSQPSCFPELSLADGGTIGFAILVVWAGAYMARALRVGGSA
jgi:hypothetical protein